MATAQRKQSGRISLKLSQDEADLIRNVFGDIHTHALPAGRERRLVSEVFYALYQLTERRTYDLELNDAGRIRQQAGLRPF